MLLFASILFLVVVFIRYAEPVKDGDIWFHLAYGRYMLENHTLVPDHAIYSWTPADNSQIYCAWIPEIILYLLYSLGGVSAFFVLRYACILLFLLFVLLYMKKNHVLLNPLAWLMALTGVLMCQAAVDIKPEIFSFVFMTITVWAWLMMRSSRETGWRYCYLVPLIMLLWVNSHGGFIFGIIFLTLVSMGEIANYCFSPDERLDAKTLRHFMFSMLLSFLVIYITPYGWGYPSQLFHDLVLNSSAQVKEFKTIGAYQSIFHPDARAHHFIDYLMVSGLVLVFLFWTVMRKKRPNWALILANIGMAWLYTQFIRTTYFWGVLSVFSAVALIGQGGADLGMKERAIRKYMGISAIVLCIIISGREVYQTFCKPLFGFWVNYYSPIEEADYIRTNLRGYTLGNDYNCGTYLLWRLWPERKVFIDARYFPYKSWYGEYASFVYGRNEKYRDDFLARYRCDAWCATYDFPRLSYFVKSPDWRLVHYGPSACIFVRKSLDAPSVVTGFDGSRHKVRTFQALKIIDLLVSAGELEGAVTLAGGLEKSPVCPAQNRQTALASVRLGDALARKGRNDGAIGLFEKALGIYPLREAGVHSTLGSLYRKKGDLDKAIREYVKALDIQQDHVPALHNLGVIYSQKGDFARALAYMKKVSDIQPENPDNAYNISCIYARQGRIDEATAWLDMAVKKGFHNWELLKKDPDLYNIRGTGYYKGLVNGK
jgi:tetratricopeptide (TPR) repeat protein